MIFKALFFLTIISQVAYGQTEFPANSKPFTFIDSVITKDKLNVEILDFVFSQDVQEILERLQKSMAENKEWSEEYFSKNYKAGEGLPYHEKFGVTREEYQKIKDLDKTPPTVVVKSTGSIKRNKTHDILSFTAMEDNLMFFEVLRIGSFPSTRD